MILTPVPLQRPALAGTPVRPLSRGGVLSSARALTPTRPVLQTAPRVPQQLCLDLQPRLR
jgi:hypothetical protein